jgi:thiamine biosynthesis lipoprotein
VIFATLCACLAACAPRRDAVTIEGATMGTTYHVVVADSARTDARQLQQQMESVLAEVNLHLSTYSASSEISRFNQSASTEWTAVSTPLHEVIGTAQRVSQETGGAFDITVAPLVRLWGFGAEAGLSPVAAVVVPPTAESVREARAASGFANLELRDEPGPAIRKRIATLALDVNAIAPGYAVDRMAEALEQLGLSDYLVEIGGEVRAAGRRPDGRAWQVAIEAPVAGERKAYAGLQLSNLAVSTSGNYRDFRRFADGRVISHTIDPRTGEPVLHGLVSVTVVHPSAMDADAYATALMVLGPEEGYALAERLGLPVLFLERTAAAGVWRERATPGFDQLRRPVD